MSHIWKSQINAYRKVLLHLCHIRVLHIHICHICFCHIHFYITQNTCFCAIFWVKFISITHIYENHKPLLAVTLHVCHIRVLHIRIWHICLCLEQISICFVRIIHPISNHTPHRAQMSQIFHWLNHTNTCFLRHFFDKIH